MVFNQAVWGIGKELLQDIMLYCLNNKTMDNKISFISGFMFTALSTITLMGVAQAAMIGLVGGFFGLLGKELFYYLKGKINGGKST
jgi:hypothetical protein